MLLSRLFKSRERLPVRKFLLYPLIATVCLAVLIVFVLGRGPNVVPVALFYEEADPSSTVVSRQSLQAVVLAMEFFNSRSESYIFVPVPFSGIDMETSMQEAAARNAVVMVGGINTSFASILAGAARRAGLPMICLAPGEYLARSDDFVFRPRPDTGGKELGRAAKRMGIRSYTAVVSGTNVRYVQEFIRDFESGAEMPPNRTVLFKGSMDARIADFRGSDASFDAVLLVLPDWLAGIAARGIHAQAPKMALFASNWAISHRTAQLAESLGDRLIVAATTHRRWDSPENEFLRFVEDTYGRRLTPITLSTGYDTVAMLDAAIRNAGSNAPKDISAALKRLQNVPTVGGVVPVDANGDMRQSVSLFSLDSRAWKRLPDTAGTPLRKEFAREMR